MFCTKAVQHIHCSRNIIGMHESHEWQSGQLFFAISKLLAEWIWNFQKVSFFWSNAHEIARQFEKFSSTEFAFSSSRLFLMSTNCDTTSLASNCIAFFLKFVNFSPGYPEHTKRRVETHRDQSMAHRYKLYMWFACEMGNIAEQFTSGNIFHYKHFLFPVWYTDKWSFMRGLSFVVNPYLDLNHWRFSSMRLISAIGVSQICEASSVMASRLISGAVSSIP